MTHALTAVAKWQDYLELCKPKVVLLMLLTSLVGMLLATPFQVPWSILFWGNLGIAFAAGAAAVINHVADQGIDALMMRTHHRPLPSQKITTKQALSFAMTLSFLSMGILLYFVNALTAILTFFSLVGYALIYTLYLKRATPQNIVIGGITGAAPPLLGWVAVTGTVDPFALLLVLIIFIWTPPHFWALAIHRKDEYAKANIPMLPVTHGVAFTKLCITLYTILLILITIMPYLVGMCGLLYLISALLLGAGFLYYALALQFGKAPLMAMQTFRYSIVYLMLLFLALLTDHYVTLFL